MTGRRAIAVLTPCQIADRGIQQVCPTALFVRPTAAATEMFAAVSKDPPRNPQHSVKWIRNTSGYHSGAATEVSRCAATAVSKARSSRFFRVERQLFMDSFDLFIYLLYLGSGPHGPDAPRPNTGPLCPMSDHGSPEALLKLQMAPKLML